MSESTAKTIYALLVNEAGALDTPAACTQFVHALTANGTQEYRFMGRLGFGGKFWNAHDRWYVTCYPEDETAERRAIIQRINEVLAVLHLQEHGDERP